MGRIGDRSTGVLRTVRLPKTRGRLSALVRLVPARRRARRDDRSARRSARLRRKERPLNGLVRRRLAALVLLLAWLLVTPTARATERFPKPPAWWLNGPGACVRTWESGDGRASANLYGMLDGWRVARGRGVAGRASRAEQDYRAWRLYLRFGWNPWRPNTTRRCGLD